MSAATPKKSKRPEPGRAQGGNVEPLPARQVRRRADVEVRKAAHKARRAMGKARRHADEARWAAGNPAPAAVASSNLTLTVPRACEDVRRGRKPGNSSFLSLGVSVLAPKA